MISWKQVKLGAGAIEYMRERLCKGHTLSKYLLESGDLSEGVVSACIPSSVSDETAQNFRDGPLLPQPSPEEHIREQTEDGSIVTLVPVPNTDNILAEIIKNFLRRMKAGTCIFEEAMTRPSDPCMMSSEAPWFEYNDEVYYILVSDGMTLKKIRQAITLAVSVYPGLIGAMTTVPDTRFLLKRRRISLNGLRELAQNTEQIVIGAYDGEGYLIWQRGK